MASLQAGGRAHTHKWPNPPSPSGWIQQSPKANNHVPVSLGPRGRTARPYCSKTNLSFCGGCLRPCVRTNEERKADSALSFRLETAHKSQSEPFCFNHVTVTWGWSNRATLPRDHDAHAKCDGKLHGVYKVQRGMAHAHVHVKRSRCLFVVASTLAAIAAEPETTATAEPEAASTGARAVLHRPPVRVAVFVSASACSRSASRTFCTVFA